ncbi:MAG TPA: DUF4279 domain-containing protein [Steroidobacter sp.]|uniref:DUF4279 domain-containing protein n=1 Tax=Steroidobacter sp. TaxID=1978227 RepID=UPI002ED88FA2
MAVISRTVATLRISGEELDPEEVSALLGHPPDKAQRKGDEIVGRNTGTVRIARFGMWRLRAPDAEPGDLDAQVSHILGKLTDDLTVWKHIASRFQVDLFCGLFMDKEIEGLSMSPRSLLLLGERGIEIGLDIYSGDGEQMESG